MNRGHRRIALVIALLAALLAIGAVTALHAPQDEGIVQGNLIANGDFSAVTGNVPDGWEKGMWVTSAGASYLEAVTLEDGTHAVLIENAAANDARFEQTVAVRPNATYRLTARVRAEGIDPAKTGANVSFLGIYGTSESVYDTDGAWTTVTLYAQTGKDQREATVCLRLGLTLRQISRGIAKLEPVEHRLQLIHNPGAYTIIDDAFNSNPRGAEAALNVLKDFSGRRIVITPGMVELGAEEAEFNRKLGRFMADKTDIAILVGKKHTRPIAEGLAEAGFPEGKVHQVASLNEATALLAKLGLPGDTVLFENDLPDNYSEE